MGGAFLLFSAFVGEAAANNSPSFCMLCTGFRIPVRCYDEMARAVSADAVFGDENQTLSLGHSARELEKLIMQKSSSERSFLVGHSRGGAVATLAALATTETRKRVSGLILVDPVDDELRTVQTALLLAESNYTLEFPILVISTPFAGMMSSFYKTPYKSVCAPDGRGPNSFYSALKPRARASLTLVTLPSLGHLSLLSSGIESLPIAHICGDAVNSNRLVGKDSYILKKATLDLLSTFKEGRSIKSKLTELRQIDDDTTISSFTTGGGGD